MGKLLDKIEQPEDIKALNIYDLKRLSKEIRDFLIHSVSESGGHFSSNLGVVELTVALHYVFTSPKDKIVWDVGHQSYVHKILTGRKEKMDTIRTYGGLSGFPKRSESVHDVFETGHSSTSVSAAIGIAEANRLLGKSGHVISVIGDGALTGGMAMEGLNNAANLKKNFIIILNDNQMSIGENVGGMANYLDKFRTDEFYQELKIDVENKLNQIPKVGKQTAQVIRSIKNGIKQLVVDGMLFEEWGFTYLGPVDGHNIRQVVEVLQQAKKVDGPVFVHLITKKGKGYTHAEKDPSAYHGVKPFDVVHGIEKNNSHHLERTSYSDLVGKTMCELAGTNKQIIAITAAMAAGTGLSKYAAKYENRFYDVGIAEQHAVTFAAGMATQGMKPFFAVYSTFLQRAYDQILHDVCLQKLPVVFLVDRAGITGNDGETHHGVFDISFLYHMPNIMILTPKDGNELMEMMKFASVYQGGPVVIRYPKGMTCYERNTLHNIRKTTWSLDTYKHILEKEYPLVSFDKGGKSLLLGVGHMYEVAKEVKKRIDENHMGKYVCSSMSIVKPIHEIDIENICEYERVFVIEDNASIGGVASEIARHVMEKEGNCKVHSIGVPDRFIAHGTIEELHEEIGLSATQIYEKIMKYEGE